MASFDHQSSNGGGPTHRGHQYTARRDVEKSATADAHISQLRLEIESRLRITLPEDISIALADGVILCHIANHVKPRAVPSIHVPSPSVVSFFIYISAVCLLSSINEPEILIFFFFNIFREN